LWGPQANCTRIPTGCLSSLLCPSFVTRSANGRHLRVRTLMPPECPASSQCHAVPATRSGAQMSVAPARHHEQVDQVARQAPRACRLGPARRSACARSSTTLTERQLVSGHWRSRLLGQSTLRRDCGRSTSPGTAPCRRVSVVPKQRAQTRATTWRRLH
jgi:hypothetical protein